MRPTAIYQMTWYVCASYMFSKLGGGGRIRTYSPEGTDLQSAAVHLLGSTPINTYRLSPSGLPAWLLWLLLYISNYCNNIRICPNRVGKTNTFCNCGNEYLLFYLSFYLHGRSTRNRTEAIWVKARDATTTSYSQ